MKLKKWIIPIIILLVLIVPMFGTYNTAVEKQESAETKWSDVENAYQRRSDLIPNLVNTVKGAADFERETLNEVVEARAKATSVNVDAGNLTPEAIAQFQEAQGGLSSALSRLLVTVEAYPELRATENFQALQSQLEGTENRINVARNRFNESVRDYNTYIRKFPQNITARIMGFDKMTRFEADAGAEVAPDVQF